MKLGLFLNSFGHHIAAWRGDSVDPSAPLDFAYWADHARRAEAAKLDFVFKADIAAPSGPFSAERVRRTTGARHTEPLTLIAALSAITRRIGLIATMSTTYNEPFHVARFFASLDRLNGGRTGWNAVTTYAIDEALNFNRAAAPPHAERYDRAEEFIDVVTGLWDGWEPDAVVADKATGVFVDTAKIHALDHAGKHFQVKGPLAVERSPQVRPVVVQAGQSDDGRELAARVAEVVFTVQQDIEVARSFRADLKARAAAHGRVPSALLVMPGLVPVVGATTAQAEAKYERLQSLIDPILGLSVLSHIMSADLSSCPIDGPLPELPLTNAQQGRQRLVIELARRENLTLRQLARRVAGARAHLTIVGTAGHVADTMARWVETGAADGFNIMPLTMPNGLDDFTSMVLPELQRRGLFRTDYDGTTLRDHLGLPLPEGRRGSGG
jgi:N-acetyl-S-(2-succino)cysteine monooxygenase